MFKQQLPMFGLTANVNLNVFKEFIEKIKQKCITYEIIEYNDKHLADCSRTGNSDGRYITNVFKYLYPDYVANVNPQVSYVKVLADVSNDWFGSGGNEFFILGFKNDDKYRLFILIEEGVHTYELVKLVIELYVEYGKLFEDSMIFDDCNFLAYKAFNLYFVRLMNRNAELSNIIGDDKNDSNCDK